MSEPINDGGPAFPAGEMYQGMSLRDAFALAVAAGQASIVDDRAYHVNKEKLTLDQWRDHLYRIDAEHCWRMADAMLEARTKETPK